MVRFGPALLAGFLLSAASLATVASGETIRVGVVQSVIEETVDANRDRIVRFIGQAKEASCDLVIFSENELHLSGAGGDAPTKREMDSAVAQIRAATREADLAVVFGADSRRREGGSFSGRAYAFGPDGETLEAYWKNSEAPRPFDVAGVRCNFTICSDRGYLEHSDLPCLVDGTRIIIDTSGGHGGDDGRPGLRWIRYRPWALRTGAWVIVSNPFHPDTDFMGNSPWGGGSAVIRPDGSIAASLVHEKGRMIVVDIDPEQVTREAAERRRENPLFREFWDLGEQLLAGEEIAAGPDIVPFRSAARDIKIAAAQIVSKSNVEENTDRIVDAIREAAGKEADIVVFPELAVTGGEYEEVLAAGPPVLEEALHRIQDAARANGIYVIAGMPSFVEGARRNSAVVIADDGNVLTRYDQLATDRGDLFQPGTSAKAMWFTLKGVHSIVTIGGDADWVEIGDLAAARGVCLRFHIANTANASPDDAVLNGQRYLLALSYAQFGAAVNARGGTLIASREGGHNQPAPDGLEYYLPYQTSVVCSAGSVETILYATRRTEPFNGQDLNRYWRNRQRKNRAEPGWHDWIKTGARLINADDPGVGNRSGN